MKLLNIQQLFNESFNIEHIKTEAENSLYTYLNNNKFLREEFGNDIDVCNLHIEYSHFQIFINTVSGIPFFRVRYKIYVKGKILPKFWYEMEFDSSGNIQDDYFDLV